MASNIEYPAQKLFVARITAVGSAVGADAAGTGYIPHAWQEVRLSGSGRAYVDDELGLVGTTTVCPAYTLNGETLAVDDIVYLRMRGWSDADSGIIFDVVSKIASGGFSSYAGFGAIATNFPLSGIYANQSVSPSTPTTVAFGVTDHNSASPSMTIGASGVSLSPGWVISGSVLSIGCRISLQSVTSDCSFKMSLIEQNSASFRQIAGHTAFIKSGMTDITLGCSAVIAKPSVVVSCSYSVEVYHNDSGSITIWGGETALGTSYAKAILWVTNVVGVVS